MPLRVSRGGRSLCGELLYSRRVLTLTLLSKRWVSRKKRQAYAFFVGGEDREGSFRFLEGCMEFDVDFDILFSYSTVGELKSR